MLQAAAAPAGPVLRPSIVTGPRSPRSCQPTPRQEEAVTDEHSVAITLPADVNQVDDTGYIWACLSEAAEPDVCDLGR